MLGTDALNKVKEVLKRFLSPFFNDILYNIFTDAFDCTDTVNNFSGVIYRKVK